MQALSARSHVRRQGFAAWRLSGILLAWLALHSSSWAAAPSVDHIFPPTVCASTNLLVSVIGSVAPWPPKAWADSPGIRFIPQTNSGQFRVQVSNNVPVGPHLVRFYNDEGASVPRFLIVARAPDAEEREPNDDRRQPQALTGLPLTVSGRLEKSGDVDSYEVAVAAGQTLVARVEAYVLGSPMDAVLRVVDSRGIQLALNHDDGMTLDPQLQWTASSDVRVVVQVFGFPYPAGSDVRFAGSAASVYRLHLSTGPWVRHTLPLGIRAGGTQPVALRGWNLDAASSGPVSVDASKVAPEPLKRYLTLPGFRDPVWVAVGEGVELMESAPRGSNAPPERLEIPGAVTGVLSVVGETDRYQVHGTKGAKLIFRVDSTSFGFPSDPWIAVQDSKGKELARVDDGAASDPELEWAPPEDGDYQVVVGNLLHRGGPDHIYRLSVTPARPGWSARLAESSSVFSALTNTIKLRVQRLHGFSARLNVSLRGLPAGVVCDPVAVPESGGEVSLVCRLGPDAPAFSGPIRAWVSEEGGGGREAVHSMVVLGTDNGVPNGYSRLVVDSTPDLWLTVRPPTKK